MNHACKEKASNNIAKIDGDDCDAAPFGHRALEKLNMQICKAAHLADCTKETAAVVG